MKNLLEILTKIKAIIGARNVSVEPNEWSGLTSTKNTYTNTKGHRTMIKKYTRMLKALDRAKTQKLKNSKTQKHLEVLEAERARLMHKMTVRQLRLAATLAYQEILQ